LTLSQVAVSALLIDPLPPVLALTVTPTILIIVLVTGTHAVLLATTRTGEGETIIVAATDDMTPVGIMSLIEGTEETMTGATVLATMMVATRAAIFAIAAVTMKKGIMTVDVTMITMTGTVVAIAHRVDAPGVGGGMTDHGHPVDVHVGFLWLWARAIR